MKQRTVVGLPEFVVLVLLQVLVLGFLVWLVRTLTR